jgi:hypothetical protein
MEEGRRRSRSKATSLDRVQARAVALVLTRVKNDTEAAMGVYRRCGRLLTVYNRIKLQVDLQADKSPVVVKGPFFPRVMNPRYQIRGTNV